MHHSKVILRKGSYWKESGHPFFGVDCIYEYFKRKPQSVKLGLKIESGTQMFFFFFFFFVVVFFFFFLSNSHRNISNSNKFIEEVFENKYEDWFLSRRQMAL